MPESIITIAELEAVTTAPDSSYIAIDNGTTTNKITVENFNATGASSASNSAYKAEGYACGTRDGVSIDDPSSPYYNNNALHYAQLAYANAVNAQESYNGVLLNVADASNYASAASDSADAAASSATQASNSKDAAAASAAAAAGSVTEARGWARDAISAGSSAFASARDALGYKDAALGYKNDAADSATLAESFAKGGTSSRSGEDIDNAKYYKEQAEAAAEAAESATTKVPYIGANGDWYVWDTDEDDYVDSGVEAKGDKGDDGADGADGYSPAVTIASITGGHSVTITDEDHPSGQSFNVMDGTGAGDMLASTYDDDSAVANAGGIPDYVDTAVNAYVENTLAKLDVIEDFSAYPNAVNVRNYGAVGDGTTNDYSAFSDAITYAVQNDLDVIVLPEGSYNLNPDDTANVSLILGKALTFVGESSKTTEIINSCIVAPHGITCKNITFNGGTERTVNQGGYPSFIDNREITIFATPEYADASVIYDKCVFKNTGLASVAFLSTGYTTPLVESNVTDCVFEDITFCGIFHSLNIESARVEGNVFKNIGNTLIPETPAIPENHLANKVLAVCLGDISNSSNNECSNAVIRNNVFDTLITATDTANHSHYVNANFIGVVCEDALIQGNILKNLLGYGDDREGIYTKGNHVEICDNVIFNGGVGEGYICTKYKLNTTNATRVTSIHNNVLVGDIGRGIRSYGTSYIYDNFINIKLVQMAIRGDAIPDKDDNTSSFRVENNRICCGIGPLVIDSQTLTDYDPSSSNLISCTNKYPYGVRINNNSMSVVKTDQTYDKVMGSLIKVENVSSNTEIKGNVVTTSASNAAITLADRTDASLTSDKTITIAIEDNTFSEQKSGGFNLDLDQNTHLIKQISIKNNTITKIGNTYGVIVGGRSNDEVVYESTQPVDAFYYTDPTTSEVTQRRHLYASGIKALFTSLSSSYYIIASGITKYSTDFADYALASSVPTALSSLSDDSTHRLVTDTEKSTWSGKSTVTTDHDGTASSTVVRKQRISIDGTYYAIDGSVYMEQTITLSTSASVTATFTNAAILSTSDIEVRAGRASGDVSGSKNAFPFESIYTTDGSCAVTFPKEDSAISLKVRIYIR